jgi:hypothetical protein
MTHQLKAINAYRPRLDKGTTVQQAELIRSLSHGTGLLEGIVDHTVTELRDKIIFYCSIGRAVKVGGLGIWTPAIDLYGRISINYRPDPTFIYRLNMPGMFTGKIINREFIGKSCGDLVNKWNEDYPENPVPFV